MYVSRWMTRGVALAVAAILIPIIAHPIINPDNLTTDDKGFDMMPSVVILLASLTLAVLAWGQLQYAFNLLSLNRLLRIVANGRIKFTLRLDKNASATVTFGNQVYRIEVVEPRYEMLTIYLVSKNKIEVRQLLNELVVVPASGSVEYQQIAFNEVLFYPQDLRKEMRRLRWALAFSLPSNGRFTP